MQKLPQGAGIPSATMTIDVNANTDRNGWRWRIQRLLSSRLSPGAVVALAFAVLVLVAAVAPGILTGHDPNQQSADSLLAPSWNHLFGTDNIGRDIFARVVHGTQLSCGIAAVATILALFVGTLVGLISGWVGGAVDSILMRTMDVLMSLPGLLISLVIVAALEFSLANLAVAIGIPMIGSFSRIVRSRVLQVKGHAYVEAARVGGVRTPRILTHHVMPNSVGPVMALAVLDFGYAVLAVTALSFLGFGAAPPTPDWGNLVAEGRSFMATAWWWTTLPGLVIVATVVATNTLANAFRRK